MSAALQQVFDLAMAPLLGSGVSLHLGVACSGGGDSVAVMLLARDWAERHGARVSVATVDHALRAASRAEAEGVGDLARSLGLPHRILTWADWDRRGNLQAMAREARKALLSDWARDEGISHVLLGHSLDDQAETVLLRLIRGSGVDGLAAMGVQDRTGLFFRPVLGVSRQALRDYLRGRDVAWVDDPSNDDPRFDRVKLRQAAPFLAELGLTPERLAQTASHMARARDSLQEAAAAFGASHYRQDAGGDLLVSVAAFDLSRGDLPARVFASALQWMSQSAYRPRYDALCDAARGLVAGEARTLAGVRMQPSKDGREIRLSREYRAAAAQAVQMAVGAQTAVFDTRWALCCAHPLQAPIELRALGDDALAAFPDWRASGLSRAALASGPSVWAGGELVALPLIEANSGGNVKLGGKWRAKLASTFQQFLLSH